MGNLCPCWNPEGSSSLSHSYSSIPDSDDDSAFINQKSHDGLLLQQKPSSLSIQPTSSTAEKHQSTSSSSSSASPHTSTSISSSSSSSSSSTATSSIENNTSVFRSFPDKNEIEKEYDMNTPVFKGMIVQQKFFNKSSYDPKFVWINLNTRSLCLSEHSVKERRHKEANIADITGVLAGPPEKYKATNSGNANGNDGNLTLNPDLCLSIKFVRGGGIDLQFQSIAERDTWYTILTRLILQEKELRKSASSLSSSALSSINPTSTTTSATSGNKSQ
jgi:hypothetical protein